MIDLMISNKGNTNLKDLFKICELELDKLFNEQIVKFELLTQSFMQMKDQITQKLKEYKEIQVQLIKVKESFFEKCHCNLLSQLIDQLKELDKQPKSDQYQQIIAAINSTIEIMLNDNCSLITKNKNKILEFHQQMNLQKHIIPRQFPNVQTDQFYKIIKQNIEQGSKKQIKQLNLIYLGTRDGLNAKGHWSKVNGKKHLLIIMQSQINQVFGGYSPCQWKSCGGKYVYDDTLTSFLFSQTKNQIYPLNKNNKKYAIVCNSSCAPRSYEWINNDCNSIKKLYKLDFTLNQLNQFFDHQNVSIFQLLFFPLQLLNDNVSVRFSQVQ